MPQRNDADLWHALGLGDPPAGAPPVVAIVGGGGKTTLMYRLAREASAMGRRTIVTGTTRFTRKEPMPPLVQAPVGQAASRLVAAWSGDPEGTRCVVLAGDREQPAGRLDPLAPEAIDVLRRLPGLGLIVIEADGSKMRPFKAPAEHEPVIPSAATHVVVVVGADALEAPLDEVHVHRPERVREILGHDRIRAVHEGDMCDAEMIAAVMTHPLGGRKGVERRDFTVVVNKADIDLDAAVRLARAIRAAGVPRVVITSLKDQGNPVREVLR
jgi:molybdenum cofactor cytidylyltransferase